MPIGDLLAGLLNVADAQVQPFPDPPESLSCVLHDMMLSQHVPNRPGVTSPNQITQLVLQARIIAVDGQKKQGRKFSFVRFSEQTLRVGRLLCD